MGLRLVARLCERKRRPHRPLAVMVRTALEAEKHALVDAEVAGLAEYVLLLADGSGSPDR